MNGGTLKALGTFSLSANRSILLDSGGGTFDTNGNELSIAGAVTGGGGLTKTGAAR